MHTLALLLALSVGSAILPATTDAPASDAVAVAPDTSRTARIQFRPRFEIGGFFSPTRGFGAGLGVGVANLGARGTDLTVDAIVQQRYQDVTVGFLSTNPDVSRTFLHATAHASTTSRRRYFGVGPFVQQADEVFLNHTAADAELSVGRYVFNNTALLIQPSVRFLYDEARSVNPASAVPLLALDEASQVAVAPWLGDPRHALSIGVALLSDFRDSRELPTSGSVFSLEGRYISATDGSGFTGTRIDAGVVGYQPLGARTVLIGRANLVTLDSPSNAVPFFYLPGMGDQFSEIFPADRRIGRDVLIVGGAVQQQLFEIPGTYGVSAILMAALGQAYNDIGSEFAPAVTFEAEAPRRMDGRAAMQPAIGIGGSIAKLSEQRLSLSGLIGFGPAGLRVATLNVAYDLRATRPVHR